MKKLASKKFKSIDPLRPPPQLLKKLHTIALQAENLISPKNNPVDRVSLENALYDDEVGKWVLEMSMYTKEIGGL